MREILLSLQCITHGKGQTNWCFWILLQPLKKEKHWWNSLRKVAAHINIPFTVGGGIASVENAFELLQNGADKISVNSAAFKNPALINEMAKEFGSQCVVLAIDTKKEPDGNWYVYLNGGRIKTGMRAFDWAKQAVDLGVGEILLTSMNNDGTKDGFAEDITSLFSAKLPFRLLLPAVRVPCSILQMYL